MPYCIEYKYTLRGITNQTSERCYVIDHIILEHVQVIRIQRVCMHGYTAIIKLSNLFVLESTLRKAHSLTPLRKQNDVLNIVTNLCPHFPSSTPLH